MKRNNQWIIGIVFLLIGILLFFYDRKVDISVRKQAVWIIPIFLMSGGIIFHVQYFINSYKNRRLLIPGGMLITYSILALICISNNSWKVSGGLWLLFPLGFIIGFAEYRVSYRNRNNIFIPLSILGGVGVIFLCMHLNIFTQGRIIGIIFLIIGYILIIKNRRKGFF